MEGKLINGESLKISNWALVIIFVVALSFLPLLTHSLLNHPPEYDELLHVLSARSMQESGLPAIADGSYSRALLYTKIVSFAQQSGAHELVSARMPALLAGSLLVALIGVWVAGKAGWIAGMSAAIVLAIMPETIHLSVLVRFYTLHALLMAIMLIIVFESLQPHPSDWRRLGLLIGAVVCFLLGMQLQDLSQVTALSCIIAAACVVLCERWKVLIACLNKYPRLTLIAFTILLAFAAYLAVILDITGKLRGFTPAWSLVKANDPFFYIKSFTPRFPLLWPLFPLVVLMAFLVHRKLTVYFFIVVVVSILISSIASQKATRYIYHVVPAISILYGLGIHAIVTNMTQFVSLRSHLHQRSANAFVVTLLLGCALISTELQRAAKLVLAKGTLDVVIPVNEEPDWLLAKDSLSTHLDAAETLIVSSGVKALYAYGRYDFELNRTIIDETDTKTEFGYDARTGRHVISSPSSVKKVMSQPGSEVIVLENRMINKDYSAPAETVAVIKTNCVEIIVPAESLLTAWRCE